MAKTNQNIEMYSGDSYDLEVTVTDENGAIVNISGASITWSLYKSVASPTLVSKGTSTSGITITDAVNGKFTVSLVPADTQKLAGTYEHSAKLTDIRSYTSTIFVGTATIIQSK